MARPGRPAITPRQRKIVAEAIRAGLSRAEAARAAGISRASVGRLLADPSFGRAVRGEPIITAGPVSFPGHHDDAEPKPKLPSPRAWISVPDLEVLGSVLHPDAHPDDGNSAVRIELVFDSVRAAEVRAALEKGELPPDDPAARFAAPLILGGLLRLQAQPLALVTFLKMHDGVGFYIPPDLLPADTAPDARALFERLAAEALPGSIPLASVAAAERLLAVLEEQREPGWQHKLS